GMKLAAIRAFRQRAIDRTLEPRLAGELATIAEELSQEAAIEIEAQGGRNIAAVATAHIRYDGSDTTLPVSLARAEEMTQAFVEAHARQFGFGFEGKPLIVESIELEAATKITTTKLQVAAAGSRSIEAKRRARFYSQGAWRDCDVVATAALAAGMVTNGPALLIEPHQ